VPVWEWVPVFVGEVVIVSVRVRVELAVPVEVGVEQGGSIGQSSHPEITSTLLSSS
jgi:hypothetical protein